MGMLFDAGAILFGGLLGGICKKKVQIKSTAVFAIGIMLLSAVGLLENLLTVSDGKIIGEHTVVVVIALFFGTAIGDQLHLDERIYSLSKTKNVKINGLIDSLLFFGIGGLQISGPMVYALQGDSFQLIVKGVIDFPFALICGATYGKTVSLSSIGVFAMQVLIAVLTYFLGSFIGADLLCQLCSLGYVILFFTGFNMICSLQNKVKNINMIPGMLLIIGYHIIREVFFS